LRHIVLPPLSDHRQEHNPMSITCFGPIFSRDPPWGEKLTGLPLGATVEAAPPCENHRRDDPAVDDKPQKKKKNPPPPPGQNKYSRSAAKRTRCGSCQVCFEGVPHRHADPADDREHRPASKGTTATIKNKSPPRSRRHPRISRNTASAIIAAAGGHRHVKPRACGPQAGLAREAIKAMPRKCQITVNMCRWAA